MIGTWKHWFYFDIFVYKEWVLLVLYFRESRI